jgi:hypothetical protein
MIRPGIEFKLIPCLGLAQPSEKWRFDGGAGYPLNNDAGAGTIDMLERVLDLGVVIGGVKKLAFRGTF